MAETKAEIEQPEPLAPIRREKGRGRTSNIRYTEHQYEVVKEMAEICGKPITAFIRDESLAVQFKARPFLRNAEVIGELRACGVALDRLATTARETGALPEAHGLESALDELQSLVRRIASAGSARAR